MPTCICPVAKPFQSTAQTSQKDAEDKKTRNSLRLENTSRFKLGQEHDVNQPCSTADGTSEQSSKKPSSKWRPKTRLLHCLSSRELGPANRSQIRTRESNIATGRNVDSRVETWTPSVEDVHFRTAFTAPNPPPHNVGHGGRKPRSLHTALNCTGLWPPLHKPTIVCRLTAKPPPVITCPSSFATTLFHHVTGRLSPLFAILQLSLLLPPLRPLL